MLHKKTTFIFILIFNFYSNLYALENIQLLFNLDTSTITGNNNIKIRDGFVTGWIAEGGSVSNDNTSGFLVLTSGDNVTFRFVNTKSELSDYSGSIENAFENKYFKDSDVYLVVVTGSSDARSVSQLNDNNKNLARMALTATATSLGDIDNLKLFQPSNNAQMSGIFDILKRNSCCGMNYYATLVQMDNSSLLYSSDMMSLLFNNNSYTELTAQQLGGYTPPSSEKPNSLYYHPQLQAVYNFYSDNASDFSFDSLDNLSARYPSDNFSIIYLGFSDGFKHIYETGKSYTNINNIKNWYTTDAVTFDNISLTSSDNITTFQFGYDNSSNSVISLDNGSKETIDSSNYTARKAIGYDAARYIANGLKKILTDNLTVNRSGMLNTLFSVNYTGLTDNKSQVPPGYFSIISIYNNTKTIIDNTTKN